MTTVSSLISENGKYYFVQVSSDTTVKEFVKIELSLLDVQEIFNDARDIVFSDYCEGVFLNG